MSAGPRITDHAVLRYIERACGVDVEGVRERIAKKIAPLVTRGMTSVSVDGLTFMLSPEGNCTTVIDKPSARAAREGALRARGHQPRKNNGRDHE